ncbi:MAG TPA: acyl carrier protein [Anaerolineae bacterium]|nr:acyl carrier protein [Anaerolineae bacterium]
MDEQTVREKLRAFITRDLIHDPDYSLTDVEGIITGGLMDSFALAEFAVYVEREFGVYIPDVDLTVAKMDTLDQMVARVVRDRIPTANQNSEST